MMQKASRHWQSLQRAKLHKEIGFQIPLTEMLTGFFIAFMSDMWYDCFNHFMKGSYIESRGIGSMGKLNDLNPKDVFYYFEEICKIPHGSGNTQKISDYLREFAKERNLEHYQDEIGNIIIIKEASPGYEDHAPVMLQGHMDMVTVKEPDCAVDMTKEGLKLIVSGDRLMAEGTSLGGDDGIAVAYGLALMDGNYRHPRLELVITVDEEVGMNGARVLDVTPLKAKRLINLDSEEEGIFLSGCAGGARVNMDFSYVPVLRKGISFQVTVKGLKGGHSGAEIHKERGNAICLLGRILYRLLSETAMCIERLEGGVADNAIPISAEAGLLLTGSEDEQEKLIQICAKAEKEFRMELQDKDGEVFIEVRREGDREIPVMEEGLSQKAVLLLNALPHGVQAMSATMPGLVETSLNPGILETTEGSIRVGISVRSSIDSAKAALIGQLKSIGALADACVEVTGDYPGWTYRKESLLREKMVDIYRELYGEEPKVEAIHAGVECGLLAYKIPELDCVSIGPEMKNIHTTEEELSISSAERVWNYLLNVLQVL